MIKAIVFDMDGVLFDTERLYNIAWKKAAQDYPIDYDLDALIVQCIGLNHNDTRALFARLLGEDFPTEEYFGRIRPYFQEMIERELPLKSGVHEILSWLKANGYPIALATSTSRPSVLSHLTRHDMLDYFDAIITGDMVEHSKPAPDIYLLACKALHTDPADCIAVEDSPNGIRSAFAAGMMPVMVPDQVSPNDELRAMLYREEPTLDALLEHLKENR